MALKPARFSISERWVFISVWGRSDTPSVLCYLCRWNNTPMDEALHFGHHDVFKILQEYQVQYTPQGDSDNGKENQTVHKNLDGLL